MINDMKRYLFIVARPLQIITALSICQQFQPDEVEFLVVDWFSEAAEITKRLKLVFSTYKFQLMPDYRSAIQKVETSNSSDLFLHWDVGFQTNMFLAKIKKTHPKLKLSIFEEGIGTYRSDIYPPIKRWLFNAFGLPTTIGGSKFTERVLVYDKEKYIDSIVASKKLEVVELCDSPGRMYEKNKIDMNYIFDASSFLESIEKTKRARCVIYLSNWNYQELEGEEYFSEQTTNILKLHPHCAQEVNETNALLAPRGLPAELIVFNALKSHELVTVFHKGSSVHLYTQAENVVFINVEPH